MEERVRKSIKGAFEKIPVKQEDGENGMIIGDM